MDIKVLDTQIIALGQKLSDSYQPIKPGLRNAWRPQSGASVIHIMALYGLAVRAAAALAFMEVTVRIMLFASLLDLDHILVKPGA